MTSRTPLYGVRLRTRRLELRLPTREEIDALFDVAARGIHPPEEMPFGVAWTDDLNRDRFVEFHESALDRWDPLDWTLNLVTFLDGAPIGSQAISGERFRERRVVKTGSWLGSPFQGRGYGTEQRAAVLELAFRRLGAAVAESGALEQNLASQRVSEKLGYRAVGESTVSPRGEPIRHIDYRLERPEWRGAPVEIEGLEPCLPLFGAV